MERRSLSVTDRKQDRMSDFDLPSTLPATSSSSRVSYARLYSFALLLGLSLLQLVPQFSCLSSFRSITTGSFTNESSADSSLATKRIKQTTADDSSAPFSHDPKHEFNYTAFWQQAMKAAHKSLEEESTLPPSPCPKVYVYDLPDSLIDHSKKQKEGFGGKAKLKGDRDKKLYGGLLYETDQYAFPSILETRLRESNMCRTLDPNEADLFYAPVLPAPKPGKYWNATCSAISAETVKNALVHLNASNACKHFFAVGKGHYNAAQCVGWYSHPIPSLRSVQRLSYTHYIFQVNEHGAHEYVPNDATKKEYPNLYSVPYPSSLHFSSSKTEMKHFQEARHVLMSFIGKDSHGDVEVRQRISKSCREYKSDQVCEYIERFKPTLATNKGKATFCLEPAGDSPWRKSISDSITFGCIPVLFSELTDNVTPWFWKDWKDRARVLVPRDDFVAGRIDLKKLLQSIPPELLSLMKKTLKDKARRFQYSIDEDPEDGIRITLDNLHRIAKDMERQGVCGYKA